MKIPFMIETKEAIIKEQKLKGLYLVEMQHHADGKFLIFDSKPLGENPPTLEQRIAELEKQVAELKTKRL